ncbi:unnamed protein product [Alopecurus aequalis]
MESLISAVLGDLVSRAISVMMEKYHEQTTTEENLKRLHQLLVRIFAVVEEAEGRGVANRGMTRQVSMMMKQMFRGYYLLDYFKCRKTKTDDEEVSHSLFSQSKFNPAKRFRRISSNTQNENVLIGRESNKELKQVVLDLEMMVVDMKEFAIFLMSYPRMYRQPYGTYLYLDKYMFGRQIQREQAINFLLQAEPLRGADLGVLPIVGPGLIGKSTLVGHVCEDERVRNHFSLILVYNGNDLKDETSVNFRDQCVIKHQNIVSGEERSLLIIELSGDVDEGTWKRLLHTSERCMSRGSKIIITSRSEKMANVGTTKAIKLTCLSKEAYWYFFKTLVFGSTDPEEHPKLTSIAMELALEMGGSFITANVAATIMRANFNARFWCMVLRYLRENKKKNALVFGEYPEDHVARYIWSIAETQQGSKDRKLFLIGDKCQRGPAASGEIPMITAVDLLSGTCTPRGKFEVLSWRSPLPPYYLYTSFCESVQHESSATA